MSLVEHDFYNSTNPLMEKYLTETDFMQFLKDNEFKLITEESVLNYHRLFTFNKSCRARECTDCSGFIPTYSKEEDIVKGYMPTIKCSEKILITKRALAMAFGVAKHIPPAFTNLDYSMLEHIPDSIPRFLRTYIDNFNEMEKKGIYLHSPTHGIGRTSVLWLFMRNILQAGLITTGFIFNTMPMFVNHLQTDLAASGYPFTKKASTCEFLVLDDFGKETATPWISSRIEGILEERIWNNLPIILSSTIPPEDWAWETPKEKSMLSKIKRTCNILEIASKHNELDD